MPRERGDAFIFSFPSFFKNSCKIQISIPEFWDVINMKNNGFVKEYVIGRKDQFDLDYAIFRKATEETETREDMINYIEEKMQYVISRVASERAKTLMEEMDLI